MKAAESAPSPKSLRNRLGIVNATAKALATSPAPKYFAAKDSRATPRNREMRVSRLMRRAWWMKETAFARSGAVGAMAETGMALWDIRFPSQTVVRTFLSAKTGGADILVRLRPAGRNATGGADISVRHHPGLCD